MFDILIFNYNLYTKLFKQPFYKKKFLKV